MEAIPTGCTSDLAPRQRHLLAGSIRLSYLEWGSDGKPMLLLHGITSSAHTWWRAAPALVAQGYHVYALDMPGHGESRPTDDHHIEAIATLVVEAIDVLELSAVTLIGHSWGGAAALALASNAQGRALLKGVVLIDPALQMETEWGKMALPHYLDGVGRPQAENLRRLRFSYKDWHECDCYWKSHALTQCRAEAVRGFFVESGTWSLIPRLAQVDVPLLLLAADSKHTVVPSGVLAKPEQVLRSGLGTLAVVPGANHNMLRGSYGDTMPVLMEWLERRI